MSDGPDPPLEYRNAEEDRLPFDVGSFVAGALVGTVLVGCVGAAIAPMHSNGGGSAHPWFRQAIAFAVTAVCTLTGLGLLLRERRRRAAFLTGLLLAMGVASLIEGTCFYQM